MEYKLLDTDDTEYEMNGELTPTTIRGSMARLVDTYSFKQEIIKKSYLPGSVIVGRPRVEAKEFNLVAQFSFTTDALYDEYINGLLFFLEKAVTLQDTTNEKQTKIAVTSMTSTHDSGSTKRLGSVSISFTLLDGFWTDLTETILNENLSVGVNNIALVNDGYLPAYAKITVTVGGLCPELDIYIDETKEGLQLIDNTLGQAELDVLEIDNKEGTLMIATFDRTQNISDGTGYFPFPTGSTTLVVDIPVASTVVIAYFKRYYV